MKIVNFLTAIIVLLNSCTNKLQPASRTQENQASGKTVLRVLCYNIHHANPPSQPDSIDIGAIATVIRNQQPDLVALQELDVYTTRSGKTLHQAEELGRLTGMNAFFAKAIDYGGGEYGVAILSKLPIEQTRNYPLPTAVGTGGELRTLATAIISLNKTQKLLFACTHLDAQAKDTNRLLQAKKIIEILKDEQLPVILAGDLNAAPSSPVISLFDNHFTRTCVQNCGFTIPVINPSRTIDFISFFPKQKFKVVEHRVIPETYASDHRPVFAILEIE